MIYDSNGNKNDGEQFSYQGKQEREEKPMSSSNWSQQKIEL